MLSRIAVVATSFVAALASGALVGRPAVEARPSVEVSVEPDVVITQDTVPYGDGTALDALYNQAQLGQPEQCRNVGQFLVMGIGLAGVCRPIPGNRRLMLSDSMDELKCPGGRYRLAALAYTCTGQPIPEATLRFSGRFTTTVGIRNGSGSTSCGLTANQTERLYVEIGDIPPDAPWPDHVRVYATCCQCCEEGLRRPTESLFAAACPSQRAVSVVPDIDVPRQLPCYDDLDQRMGARIRVNTCGLPSNPFVGSVTAIGPNGLRIGTYPIVRGEAVIPCDVSLHDGSRPALTPFQWHIQVEDPLTIGHVSVEYYCCNCSGQ